MSDLKAVLVITRDRVINGALRAIIAAAGCEAVVLSSVAAAVRWLARWSPLLILIDPELTAAAENELAAPLRVVEIPLRTSASGVRRLAKRHHEAIGWLVDLIHAECSAHV